MEAVDAIDYKALTFWLHVAEIIGILVIAWHTYLSKKSSANQQKIARLESQQQEIEQRLTVVENRLSQTPGHVEIGKLHEKINIVSADMHRMIGEMVGFKSSLNLIQRALIGDGK